MNWRKWHRRTGGILGLLLLIAAASGVVLQYEKFAKKTAKPASVQQPAPQKALTDIVDSAVKAKVFADTYYPGKAIESLTVEQGARRGFAVIRFAGVKDPVNIDLTKQGKLTNKLNFSYSVQAPTAKKTDPKILLIKIHTLSILGPYGHLVGIISALSLLFLSISGLWMYFYPMIRRSKRSNVQKN